MIKKILVKLADWQRKSNWTKAMEIQGFDEIARKRRMEEAREKLKQEQEQEKPKQQTDKSAENLKDSHV